MECKMNTLWRCYNEEFGYGDVKVETEHFVVVLFDSDPMVFHQLDKLDVEEV